MITEAKNKAMPSPDETPKDVTIRAKSVINNEYHFAGSGIWEPLAVVATNIQEAEQVWRQKRKPIVKDAEPGSPAEKVESTETSTKS